MTVLPIVGRELLEASRRRSTYLIRLGAATLALGVGFVVATAVGQGPPGALGQALFVSLVVLLQIYCLLVGAFRTADCLSEEKREGTLGLLFLTDLKGHDIVLGKLVATSLNAFYGALAVLPVLAIPLLVGGVAPGDFGRTVLVALNNLFLSLAVGMFCSSFCRDERRSMNLAILILLGLAGGLPLVGSILSSQSKAFEPFFPWVVLLSPGFDAVMAFQAAASDFARQFPGWPFFWMSVGLLHALAWLLLGAACWIVPRTWQDRPLSAAALARRQRLAEADHGRGEQRASARRQLLDQNPVLWLTGRHRLKGVLVWVFLGALALIWILSAAYMDWKNLDEALTIVLLLAAHTGLKAWLASEAAQRFSQDRASGALELILSTPLPVEEILQGQRMALQRQFLVPSLVVLGVDGILGLALLNKGDSVVYWAAAMQVFVLDMLVLVPVGMWRGLNSHRANTAASTALAQILVLPWVLYALFMVFIATAGVRGGFFGSSSWVTRLFPVWSWLGICLVVDVLFGVYAWTRLNERFRELATTRFQVKGKRV